MATTRNSQSRNISRRQFLQIIAVAGGVFLGGRWVQRLARGESACSEKRLLMGTVVNLTLVTGDQAAGRRVISATFAEMARLIALFDWRQPASPLAMLNRTAALARPPADLVDILEHANRISLLTDGAFDVTVQPLVEAARSGVDPTGPHRRIDFRSLSLDRERISLAPGMQVTLDGIAKGRIVDGAVAVLEAQGYPHVLVEAGGDLLARGTRADGEPWRVGIAHPRHADSPLGILPLTGRAAATSGDYQHRFSQDFTTHHIIDPHSGLSPAELAGVTVLAPTAMDADALSTAVMVLGADAGLALIDRLPHVAALVVTKALDVRRSAGFPTV